MSLAWQTRNETPAVDWTGVDVDSHNAAYQRAKREFVESNGFEPSTGAEHSSIMRRAEAIRRGSL